MADKKLGETCEDTFRKWALFGFSTFGLGSGGYVELARQVPIIPNRQWVMEAETGSLLAAGFPVLPTRDHPHWTVVLSEPDPTQFARVRSHFSEPLTNPAWMGRR
ncbi:MAG TPA: hypothetical protein VM142_00225 [Acidimicrobiales bacterium]|nr:hypothetical protein [Acidimicrobiales bacterium]